MGDIVSLAKHREESQPHGQGPAHCLSCKHEWAAVAPIGTVNLTCPECGSHRGMFKCAYAPSLGDVSFVCGFCDSEHFYFIMKDEIRITCAGCASHIPTDTVFAAR